MKTAINLELTNTCNARCITCPRESIVNTGFMDMEVFKIFLDRLDHDHNKVSMVNLSGYGETVLHPGFFAFLDEIQRFNHKRRRPVKFATVTNGQGLDREKLLAAEGVLDRVSFSFTTSNRSHYEKIYLQLDYEQVVANLKLARQLLDTTRLVAHLTPTSFTINDIESTVQFLRDEGIQKIVLFPLTFNRAGNLELCHDLTADIKRHSQLAKKLKLKTLEEVFIPGIRDILPLLTKRTCVVHLACLYIDFHGDYHYCINDMAHQHSIGNINNMTIAQALKANSKLRFSETLCPQCNVNALR